MLTVFEVDYALKDAEAFKASPKEVPSFVLATNLAEAVKTAQAFEDDNLTLLKCNLDFSGKFAISKKAKGI
jgi:hypothetical protein